MARVLFAGGTFITMDERRPVVEGYMSVADGRIEWIGPERPTGEFDEIVDGRGKWFLPGLVNTHSHAAMSLLRGYGDDMELGEWLEKKMWPAEARFTGDDVYWGTLLAIVEMLKSGTTCFADMYDQMDRVAEAVAESGIRAALARGVIGLCPPEVQRAKLDDAVRFARQWNGAADGRITTMLAPHAPYTCPPEYIERIVEAAHELDLPVHIHLSETRREVEEHERKYGLRPVEHMARIGLFSRPCLAAHAVHLTDKEIETLAQYGVHVSHNPGSNLKLASGFARLADLLRAGVTVGLGTDGAASNNNLDMFEEIRLAALIAKATTGDATAVGAFQALRLGTVDGARALWLDDVGKLAPGMKADIIAVDAEQPHFYPRSDVVSHLVYAASGADVTDVWIDGQAVVRGRMCVRLDEERIRAEAEARFARLTGASKG